MIRSGEVTADSIGEAIQTGKTEEIRRWAALACADFGPDAQELVPVLIAALQRNDAPGPARLVSSLADLAALLLAVRVALHFFGLTAPRNALSYTTIALGGLSIASAIFVILELDTPFSGFFTVSSQPTRHALTHLTQ